MKYCEENILQGKLYKRLNMTDSIFLFFRKIVDEKNSVNKILKYLHPVFRFTILCYSGILI